MTITPLILGTGNSGRAIAKSLACIQLLQPELKLEMPIWLERGASLSTERKKYEHPLLCIANPHGLHAEAILEAERAGYEAILCEKPACVNLEQLRLLSAVKTPTAILHGYRQTWGVQTLKAMVDEKQFGDIISIEGRYWQSSAAERALMEPGQKPGKGWKDDVRLAGEFDVYLDIATHWVDAVSFLFGAPPARVKTWRSFANAESKHRDTHINLAIDYPNSAHAFGSISKTLHGATNRFELNVIGSKLAATWEFQRPDEILIGVGRDSRILTRKDNKLGSRNSPHHGMGWLEGYIEITSCLLRDVFQGQRSQYPNLKESLLNLEPMLKTEWQE